MVIFSKVAFIALALTRVWVVPFVRIVVALEVVAHQGFISLVLVVVPVLAAIDLTRASAGKPASSMAREANQLIAVEVVLFVANAFP